MLFYYVQIKDRHDPRSKNQRKSKCSKRQQSWGLEGKGVWWSSDTLSRDFRGQSLLGKILGSKENLDWLKIDLNMTKIITAQDFKRTKNLCEWKYLYTAKSRAANIWVKDIMTTFFWPNPKVNQLGILKIYTFCKKIQQRASGPGESVARVTYLSMRIHPKRYCISPLKVDATVIQGRVQLEHSSHLVMDGVEATS